MAKPEEGACGCSSKKDIVGPKKFTNVKKSASAESLNPQNVYWATNHQNTNSDNPVLLHFDDAMMKSLKLAKAVSKSKSN